MYTNELGIMLTKYYQLFVAVEMDVKYFGLNSVNYVFYFVFCSVSLSVSQHMYLPVCMFACPSLCLPIWLCICFCMLFESQVFLTVPSFVFIKVYKSFIKHAEPKKDFLTKCKFSIIKTI